jgi:hypothetical protein
MGIAAYPSIYSNLIYDANGKRIAELLVELG